jgi:hypothetical protein
MSNLTIVAANVRLVRGGNEHQHTAPAGEVIAAGQYIRFAPSTGKFELGKATTAAEVGKGYIALNSAAIRETVTGAMRPCVIDVGDALAGLDFGDPVYLSDTDGTLDDTKGTVNKIVGTVVPGWANTTADKLLELGNELTDEPVGS